MPRQSGKDNLLNALCFKSLMDVIVQDSSSEDEDDDVLIDFTLTSALVLSSRRSCHFNVPKSVQWRENVLPNFDDSRMRQMLRVEPIEFEHILTLIKEDPVFKNKKLVPQLPVDLQLKITLFRLGSSGDNASLRKVATLFGVGDAGTIIKVTQRVVASIVNLKSKFLFCVRLFPKNSTSDHWLQRKCP
ncbi:uncharacterized protein LOC118742613 [Rhagoletis pomonella]|uniref:uncharacterized protein LOC118742613 n=1 Tax=Rhagoletis pomonella TaxID=28610 RepID=UPI001780A09E|nr:uncharacterized protein LOC118742613 [Rhagoletis pomonella]